MSKIYFGKSFSLLLTRFGEIFITGNYNPKTVPTEETGTENVATPAEDNKKKSIKAVKTHKPDRWVNITKEICFDVFLQQNKSKISINIKYSHVFKI